MILKNQVEWALHCCGIMVGLPAGHYIATKALAEFHGVPKEYLSKALQGLSQNGIISGTLGPNGGYRLAKSPDAITFLDIVEAVEGRRSTFKCTEIRANNPCLPDGYCFKRPCGIARVMWEADEAWRQKLKSVTLSDLGGVLKQEVPAKILAESQEWLTEY